MAWSPKTKKSISRVLTLSLIYVLLTCLSYVIVYPFLGRILISVMSEADLNDDTVRLFTRNFTLYNYQQALAYMDYASSFFRTALFTLLCGIIQVLSAAWVAYGFARFRFKGNRVLFACVLLTLIVPPQVISVPLYFQFRSLHLLGNILSVLLLDLAGLGLKSGLLIFMLRQYYAGFPRELEEAAAIDGSSPLRTFWRVAFPSSKPMLVTAFLFSVVWTWTDTFYPSTFLPGNSFLQKQLLQLSMSVKAGMDAAGGAVNNIEISLVTNAGEILFILPLLLVFLLGQRSFIESIERTGIVG